MDRQTDGQTDRQTDRQMDRQTDGQTDGQIDRRTDGQTDGQMDSVGHNSVIKHDIKLSLVSTEHNEHRLSRWHDEESIT